MLQYVLDLAQLSKINWGTWVDLPHPVTPSITVAEWVWIVDVISSLTWTIGKYFWGRYSKL